jgi:hypothetical protein
MMMIWIAAASITGAMPACKHEREARTQDALVQVENRWVKYLEQRDATGLACLLDDRFTDSSWRGTVYTKADILAHLGERTPGALDLKDLEARVEGTMGYVRGRTISHNAQGGVVAQARFTDIFIYRDGHWMAIAAQETVIPD